MKFGCVYMVSSIILLDIDIKHLNSRLIYCRKTKGHNNSTISVKHESEFETKLEHSKLNNTYDTDKITQNKSKLHKRHSKSMKQHDLASSNIEGGKFKNKKALNNNNHSSGIKLKKITKSSKAITQKENRTVLQRRQKKKKGKVFLDSQEEILHYKLIDNMMFKPLESNNSVSISFSDDESEITEDDVKQAIEGRDGSYFAIPLKRKKDVYKEFLRWAHKHEQNERKNIIEKEVFEKYKSELNRNVSRVSKNTASYERHENAKRIHTTETKNHTARKQTFCDETRKIKITPVTNKYKKSTNVQNNRKSNNNINNNKNKKQQNFKVESVEFQYDPDFLHTLYNSTKNQRKEESQNMKDSKSEGLAREDISADDYSAQENFMLYTQKEAMGRRFYQMFANKTASDFWDNTTLETTKMLEFLLPLGKHLHETLDKLSPNEGRHFITNLQMYKTELEKFIALVKQDKAETRNDVVDLLEEPYDHLCETKYNEDEVKMMFGWNDEEFQHFDKLMAETREMWFDLQMFHHCYQFVSDSSESMSMSYNCSDAELLHNNTFTT